MIKPTLCLAGILLLSCSSSTTREFDIQGHRGCRGHYPENSIEGFMAALEMGVTTLEMDAVITKDHKVILSHEPWISPEICLSANGDTLPSDQKLNIYQMTYKEVQKYDCGTLSSERFPEQKSISTYKPLLAEVLDQLNAYAEQHQTQKIPINLETKIQPDGDHHFHPDPKTFVALILETIRSKNYLSAFTLQSFDIRTLQEVRKQAPQVPVALLIDQNEDHQSKIKALGFDPEIMSPHYQWVDESFINHYHHKDIKVIPWTVNDSSTIQQMLDFKVDGIISDYPDRVLSLLP